MFEALFSLLIEDVLPVLVLCGAVLGTGFLVIRFIRRSNVLNFQLERHFRGAPLSQLTVCERHFPFHSRAVVYQALEELLATWDPERQRFGLKIERDSQGPKFSDCVSAGAFSTQSATVGAPEFEEIDIGEDEALQSLKAAIWLVHTDGQPLAVLMSRRSEMCRPVYIVIEVATPPGESGARYSQQLFGGLEAEVRKSVAYRGKILSLEEADESYDGTMSGIRVHRLPPVLREQVILTDKTLELLERNVVRFVEQRERLREYGLSAKKGLLFYGPPGTGKTLTIQYLATTLQGHTTLILTAEQVRLLSEYMSLARLLQPSIVVLEDVDLIARCRDDLTAGHELLLNRLLNEMDGLAPDAEILFLLTTNRPEALEAALAARPGRVDQAIEFPLPDAGCRDRLVRLYARGMSIADDLIQLIVRKTDGVSASFIKELLRRGMQFQFEQGTGDQLEAPAVEQALEELLFAGGVLNQKLLGATSSKLVCESGCDEEA